MFSLWQQTAFDNLFREVQNQATRQKLLEEMSQGTLEVGQKINYCLQSYPEELTVKGLDQENEIVYITRQEEDFVLYLNDFEPAIV